MSDSHSIARFGQAALALAFVPAAMTVAAGEGDEGGPCDPATEPWIYPTDAVNVDDPVSWARFAWDGFVALQWPQLEGGSPGEPDTTASLCEASSGRPAYLQWMQKAQLLLPGGENPGTWDEPTYSTPMYTPSDGGPTLPLLGALSKTTNPNLVDEFDEAFSHRPLLDQNGRYVLFQIFLNRSEFEYISQNGYYDAVNQYAAFQPGGEFVGFPKTGEASDFDPPVVLPDWAQQGAIELKASWKQLDEVEIASGRFFMQDVYYASNISAADPPCGPVTVGLVGLHILQLTPSTSSTWFWATFEQVDNVDVLPGNLSGVPSFNPGPDTTCPPPYDNGYACNGEICTPSDPSGGTDCPPFAPEGGVLPNVCDADPARAVNVSRVPEMTTPDDVESVNDEYRSRLPAPWRYYRLLNTIQPEDGGPACIPPQEGNTVNTSYLTNVTMETYTQYYQFISLPKCDGTEATPLSMNCTDCHAVARPLGAPTVEYGGVEFPDPQYQIFTFMLNNAKSSCPADLNHDRIVDAADLGILTANWGSEDRAYRLDGSGPVGGGDLGMLIANWGPCPSNAPPAAPREASGFQRLARSVRR
jgi:hypothetical protein